MIITQVYIHLYGGLPPRTAGTYPVSLLRIGLISMFRLVMQEILEWDRIIYLEMPTYLLCAWMDRDVRMLCASLWNTC